MTPFALILALAVLPLRLQAQEIEPAPGAKIVAAQVSGIDLTRLSPGLQEEIGKLVGTPVDRDRLRQLASRIEAEQPRYAAAVRITADSEGNARILFVVARIRDQDRDTNVNTRYVVEAVEIHGYDEDRLDRTLRDDLNALVGKPLDPDEAERLSTRLKDALPDYQVSRGTKRGTESGKIIVIYELSRPESTRWLHFEPMDANAIFHSDQGWGANLAVPIGDDDVQVVPIIPIDNADDLIEEYSGFGVRVESRRLGTERLGVFFEWATYDQEWRERTLAAMALRPDLPALYRNRMSVTPLIKFAFTPQVSIGGGVGIAELDSLVEPGPSRMANTAIGFVRFGQQWRQDHDVKQNVRASFTTRAGTRALQSDLVYERYRVESGYTLQWHDQDLLASFSAGAIRGQAPMVERFSLGDSRTLRGWDKYDITPVGGNRMFATSLEYRYSGVGVFVDAGSVWDDGAVNRVRFSTGVTFNPGPVFFTVGFPLNTDEFHAVFTMGLRIALGYHKP